LKVKILHLGGILCPVGNIIAPVVLPRKSIPIDVIYIAEPSEFNSLDFATDGDSETLPSNKLTSSCGKTRPRKPNGTSSGGFCLITKNENNPDVIKRMGRFVGLSPTCWRRHLKVASCKTEQSYNHGRRWMGREYLFHSVRT